MQFVNLLVLCVFAAAAAVFLPFPLAMAFHSVTLPCVLCSVFNTVFNFIIVIFFHCIV